MVIALLIHIEQLQLKNCIALISMSNLLFPSENGFKVELNDKVENDFQIFA